MTGVTFHSTSGFCICSLWQKRKPSRDQRMIFWQRQSFLYCPLWTQRSSVEESLLPVSTLTVSAWIERKVRWSEEDNNWRTHCVWWGLKDAHTDTNTHLSSKVKTWESRSLREAGCRNGELMILGKLMGRSGDGEPGIGHQYNSGTWAKMMSIAVDSRRGS